MMNVTGWPPMGAPRLRARHHHTTHRKIIIEKKLPSHFLRFGGGSVPMGDMAPAR